MIRKTLLCAALAATLSVPAAAGGLPVIDVASIAQAIKQVTAWQQQYSQMNNQILQAQTAFKSMTGDRGMANLLAGSRSYLPADWNNAMTALTSAAQTIKSTQSVLTQKQFSALSPLLQQFTDQARTLSAAQQATGQAAYNKAAARVVLLQDLTQALVGITDPAAVMQLTARIQSEQAGLANDQAQLQALAQLTVAQDQAQRQMANEIRVQTSGDGKNIPRIDTSLPF